MFTDILPRNIIYHLVCQNFLTTVAILLEAGSYVNAQALSGETALMKVVENHSGMTGINAVFMAGQRIIL